MTEKMIENRVKKLRNIEAQQKELEAQTEAIRAELKADLEEKGVEELQTKNFLLRWKEIVSNRLDGKALKAALHRFPGGEDSSGTEQEPFICQERFNRVVGGRAD